MSESGWNQNEERRREADRRGAGRQGKYDRRRNRCGHCAHYEEREWCAIHQRHVTVESFACPQFEQAK